jgi:hypothetical protein
MAKRPEKPPIQPHNPNHVMRTTITLGQERLIGRLIVAWSKLEAAMEDYIWALLGVEIDYGRVVTAKLDASSRIQMIASLALLEYPKEKSDEVKELMSQIDILRDDRNFVMHGSWGMLDVWSGQLAQTVPVALSVRIKHDPLLVVGESFPETRMHALIRQMDARKRDLIALINARRSTPPEQSQLDQSTPPPNPEDQTQK